MSNTIRAIVLMLLGCGYCSAQEDKSSSLSRQQLESLSIEQIQAIEPSAIARLSGRQLRALTNEQLRAFTPAQVRSLSPKQFGQMSADQLAALLSESPEPIGDAEAIREARGALTIIQRCCGRCHAGSIFDAMDARDIIDNVVDVDAPDFSPLLEQIEVGAMPPRNRLDIPRPTPEETKLIRNWIARGALVPQASPREAFSTADELEVILRFLQTQESRDAPRFRFFTIGNLLRDAWVNNEQIRTTKLALAKVINSLSWETRIIQPVALDRNGSEVGFSDESAVLFAIDLQDIGWDIEYWEAILREYPYAVGFNDSDNRRTNLLARIGNTRGGEEQIAVRADWFISVGTSPKLYNQLLYELAMPELRRRATNQLQPDNPKDMTDADLERFIGLDVEKNILTGRAKRSGYAQSGVSGQNRMIERHSLSRNRSYWKSYDFKDSNRRSVLTEFPFGPAFEGSRFDQLAFNHDGGEIIFNLPNGLQAYLLVDGEGNRINAGPIDVVADALKTSGNEEIVVGVSCIACHRHGMIDPPTDEIRDAAELFGEPQEYLKELYPEPDVFQDWIDKDREVFLESLEDAVGTDELESDSFPEPVGAVARQYFLNPMRIETVAAELDVEVGDLKATIKSNRFLREVGLRVLLRQGGSIKRAAWESRERPLGNSFFQEVAREFSMFPMNRMPSPRP